MSVASSILKAFNLYVDGRGHAGEVDELQLPALTLIIDDHRGGGMDGSIPIDLGMEPMTGSFTLSSAVKDTLARFGIVGETTFVARGSVQGYTGGKEPVEVTMRGIVTSIEPGAWSGGSKVTTNYNIAITYYRYSQGGRVIHEIDVPNMIRIIDGVDQLAEHRKNIGLI